MVRVIEMSEHEKERRNFWESVVLAMLKIEVSTQGAIQCADAALKAWDAKLWGQK